MPGQEPTDIVYTWVDDSFAGYREVLNRYVADPRDTNPNRTRDNLNLIRYSLRSVARHMPWVRRIYFVSMRPQVPPWLNTDHPKLRVVHHDEIMDPAILPTFNSFAIVSHLHLLPGLSRRFFYIEDDMLAMSDLRDSYFAPDGRPYVHFKPRKVKAAAQLDAKHSSPWNLALANASAALADRFGGGPRNHVIHGPKLLDVKACAAMCRDFADLIETTRASRFRGTNNVPPEFLAPHYAVETGAAVRAPQALSNRVQGYASLENLTAWTRAQLAWLALRKPHTLTLNDSFGDAPNPRAEALIRARLNAWFPDPSPFETPAAN